MTQPSDSQLAFVYEVTQAICRHNLRQPALILLEAGRPLGLLAAQFIWLAQPILALFYPRQTISQLAEVLEEPDTLSQLITELEAQANEWRA